MAVKLGEQRLSKSTSRHVHFPERMAQKFSVTASSVVPDGQAENRRAGRLYPFPQRGMADPIPL